MIHTYRTSELTGAIEVATIPTVPGLARRRAPALHDDVEWRRVQSVIHVSPRASARGPHYKIFFTDGTTAIAGIHEIGAWIGRRAKNPKEA